MLIKPLILAIASLATLNAQVVIDFEAQGAGKPGVFTYPMVNVPLTIGIATFSGGEVLSRGTGISVDTTAIYATATSDVPGFNRVPPYSNPITISFSAPIQNFSVDVIANSGLISVINNRGGSDSHVFVTQSAPTLATLKLQDSYVTSISILYSCDTRSGTSDCSSRPYDGWDFSIDNVTFTPMVSPTRVGALPHIAAGGGWSTAITLSNPSAANLPVSVLLHGDDGSPLQVPSTTMNQGASQSSSSSQINATIAPNSTLFMSIGDQTTPRVSTGWAEILSTGSVTGYAVFRTTNLVTPTAEGSVSLQTQLPPALLIPFDNTSGFVMGIALANPSNTNIGITATAWDEDGNLLSQTQFAIPSLGHTSFVMPDLVRNSAGRRGIVEFRTNIPEPLSGLGLRFSPFNTFTSVPAN